jgi:hypothetical protein
MIAWMHDHKLLAALILAAIVAAGWALLIAYLRGRARAYRDWLNTLVVPDTLAEAEAEAEQDDAWADELGEIIAERDEQAEAEQAARAERDERIADEADLMMMQLYGIGDSDALLAGIRAAEAEVDALLAAGEWARADWLAAA